MAKAHHVYDIDGADVTTAIVNGSLVVTDRLANPSTAKFGVKVRGGESLGPSREFALATEDGFRLTTEDGAIILIPVSVREPGRLAPVTISYPRRTYRDTALLLQPWLYWALDERHTGTVHDLAGTRAGAFGAASGGLVFRQGTELPYGGSCGAEEGYTGTFATGPAAGAAFGAEWTLMTWWRLDAATGTGRCHVARCRAASNADGLDLQRNGNAVSLQIGARAPIVLPAADGNWRHLAITQGTTETKVYVNGALTTTVAGASPALVGAWEFGASNTLGLTGVLDELSLWTRALTAAEVENVYGGRDARRRFDGFIERAERHGVPTKDYAVTDCQCISRAVFLRRKRTRELLSATGADSATTVIEQLIAKELPNTAITTGGVDLPEKVPTTQANLDQITSILDRFMQEYDAPWWLDVMNELQQVPRSAAPLRTFVFDERTNIDDKGFRKITDSRLFRNIESVAHAGGALHNEEFTGDGTNRVFQLEYPIDEIIAVSLGGSAEDVDDGTALWRVSGRDLLLSPAQTPPTTGTVISVAFITGGVATSNTFTGDGVTRSWTLTAAPDTPIADNVSVVVAGRVEEADKILGKWASDRDQNTLIRPLTQTAPGSGVKVLVQYTSAPSSVVQERSEDSIAIHGPWESLEVVNPVRTFRAKQRYGRALLDRYDLPIETITGAVRKNKVDRLELGARYPVYAPKNIGEVGNRNFLLDGATMREDDGRWLSWQVRLSGGAYAPAFQDTYQRMLEPAIPPAGAIHAATATQTGPATDISPETLVRVGSRLPAVFGGSEVSKNPSTSWVRTRGSAILLFVGILLPRRSARLTFTWAIVRGRAGDGPWSAQVRLRDLTDDETITGSVVTLTVPAAEASVAKSGETPVLTLPPGSKNYQVECRVLTPGARIAVWGAQLAV